MIETAAIKTPAQFTPDNFSLKTKYPVSADNTTIETLKTGKKNVLSKIPSPFKKKYVEPQLSNPRINPAKIFFN